MNQFKKQNPTMEWITYDIEPIIRQKSLDVVLPLTADHVDVIEKLISYVDYSFENQHKKYNILPGVGMASIQVGKLYRLAYIHFFDEEVEHRYLFANPEIIKESSRKIYLHNGEGCLSVDCKHEGIVPRSAKIKIKFLDLFTNKEDIIEAEGYLAIVFQHEIDHTNGKLYYDKINKFNANFAKDDWEKI